MTNLKDLEPRIWFADTEVFAHDNIWVFTQYGTGATEVFWNDNEGVQDFIGSEHPILCGYNFRDYDQHILKGVLCGMTPEQLKEVNDIIIEGGEDEFDHLWSYFRGKYQKTPMPSIIDLFHDIVPRRSLKVIEGNLGMSVKESSVPFDIQRALTREEVQESIDYCKYDVYATSKLFEHRREYLQSKITLCEICGEDLYPMLKHSNARILSEVFHAEPYAYDPNEKYVIPDTIDLSGIPAEVLAYVGQIDCSVATRDKDLGKLEFLFHGVPSVFGIGGIHSADSVPYIERETDGRVILIQDITSYYPSIILEYGYVSRAAGEDCKDMYRHFYDLRVEAKAKGDKETANAAKLVLNTYSGAMGDKYNKLYDPMMPLGMRITGQLAIMDAVNCAMRNAPSARFIQLNTDGWVLSVNRDELDAVLAGVKEWEERTRFTVDTQFVRTLIQRDVNNYILEKPDGSVKVKGGTVAQYGGSDFKSNSLGISHDAIVNYLLYGKPIRDTIMECQDMSRFQLMAKTGHTFDYTVWMNSEGKTRKLHMCNRIFATKDETRGMVYKTKRVKQTVDDFTVREEDYKPLKRGGMPKKYYDDLKAARSRYDRLTDRQKRELETQGWTWGESYSKVPDCPPRAEVLNGDLEKCVPDWLDREWYIEYTVRKAREFVENAIGFGGIEMAEELKEQAVETAVAKPKRRTSAAQKQEEPMVQKSFVEQMIEKNPVNLNEALFKLQILMSSNSGSVKFDGYIDNINYSYADTQQYKTLLAKCATECGLIFGMTVQDEVAYEGYPNDNMLFVQTVDQIDVALNSKATDRKKFIAARVYVRVKFTFFMTGESVEYKTVGFGVGSQGNSVPIAITNALRNFITNNFLIDNKGRDGDDVAANFMDDLVEKAKKPYVSEAEKSEIKSGIVAEKAEEAKFATVPYMENLYPKAMEAMKASAEFAEANKDKIERAFVDGKPVTREDDANHSIMPRKVATKLMRDAEAVIGA